MGSTRRLIPSGRISQPGGGTLEVGGNRERTDGVRKFRDRGSLEENASYSRNSTQFGALDATSGQPLYVSSRPSRVDDAAASRRAISHRFPRVFGGRLTGLPRAPVIPFERVTHRHWESFSSLRASCLRFIARTKALSSTLESPTTGGTQGHRAVISFLREGEVGPHQRGQRSIPRCAD